MTINTANPQGAFGASAGARRAPPAGGTLRNKARFDPMPSTVIQSFEYDADQRELRVIFRSGRRYVYEGVADDTYAAMRRSFSKGEYFNEHIRDRYPFRREDT